MTDFVFWIRTATASGELASAVIELSTLGLWRTLAITSFFPIPALHSAIFEGLAPPWCSFRATHHLCTAERPSAHLPHQI